MHMTSRDFGAPRVGCSWPALAAALLLCACGGGGGGLPGPVLVPQSLPSVETRAVAAADPGSTLPEGWMHGGLLQVYVRGYQDSDGDGIGDLRGLIARLPYIKQLGVAGIWLMPIAASQDHDHGYAVTDYRDVESAYGTLADFDELLRQAHALGLGVILDHVMNHSAAQNAAFINARAGTGNAYRDWYLWSAAHPAGWSIYGGDPWRGDPSGWYFAPFWDQMPDFNLRNPAVVAWHHDHLRFWLNRGADGFRFDAVSNLIENGPAAWENQPQSMQLMGDVRRMVAGYARRYIVCEAPGDPLAFADASACGSAFAFGHHANLVRAAAGDASVLPAVASFIASAPPTIATLLSNHDGFAGDRIFNQLQGSLPRMKLAAALLLLTPGVPFIYYGEEIGMARAASLGSDAGLRTPMSWTASTSQAGFTAGTPFRALSSNVSTANVAAQDADPASLLAHYRALLAFRSARPSIARGSFDGGEVQGGVLSFRRQLGNEQTLVAIHVASAPAQVTLHGLTPGACYASLLPTVSVPAQPCADTAGQATLTLPAQSAHAWRRLPT